jgi:hypothetical protein
MVCKVCGKTQSGKLAYLIHLKSCQASMGYKPNSDKK